jgi:hypothetical protein
LRTHQGKWMYSDKGGKVVKAMPSLMTAVGAWTTDAL